MHAALEQLYGLPATQRGPETALSLVEPAWEQLIAGEPDLAGELDPERRAQLLEEARALLSGYYRLEDPTRFDPQSCEQRVEVELADGTLLRGFIDRIDVAATGELRVVDYKTGKAPPAARALAEFKAMFQMKFYAVALLRSHGVLPARLRLIYLADGQVLDYTPDRDELLRFEKTLMAIWRAIQSAGADRRFPSQPVAAVRVVPAPATLPEFRRDPAALPRVARSRARPELDPADGMIGCYYRRLATEGDFAGLRSDRLHPEQLGTRNPARLTAVGAADKADRGTVGGVRSADRPARPGHPRSDPGDAGACPGLGGTSGFARVADGRRDVGRSR